MEPQVIPFENVFLVVLHCVTLAKAVEVVAGSGLSVGGPDGTVIEIFPPEFESIICLTLVVADRLR